ncbi:MAG TPA: DUF6515 family protein [Puia sp.]|nr:DUF6515 family protein [Puia sp.]
MPITIKHTFFPVLAVLALAGLPRQSMAQRFSHPGGGGFHPAPVQHAAPAPRQVAPAPRMAPAQRPQQMRTEPARTQPARTEPGRTQPARTEPGRTEPARTEPVRPEMGRPEMARPEAGRPTINGGARNFGNHDFSRPAPPVVRRNVDVHNRVDIHDHVNVYHTGGDRGIHPYYYHPYRPYYWGPHWHPLGFFLTSLAADAIWFNYNGQRYWYDDGCYYLPGNGGYSVVPPPVGAVVPSLPDGYETTMVGDDTYYYFGGAFYVQTDQGFEVVAAPPGAVITQLPVGAVDQQINDQDLLVYNNVYYMPISQDGQDAYEVVTP